ncbi:MAG: filamentous hemagglutinin N-terminal domain-containing protein [Symploca sp. SIO2D2]|nr:filamentous hemagglutinin N-terminal domain-containing protein [Symploca sp. SIO2D2]
MAVALGISGAVILLENRALAQSNIVPDNTLGAGENSIVIPNVNGLPVEVITGGAQRGQNLFHSFLEFNIDVGRGAYFFSGDAAIQNILARVTDVNPSEILGTLGTLGDSQPNLFLINPNGIIFGEDSKLDVGGSFVATTANAIGLGDAGRFSASEPDSSNLLNINPDVFFFNRLSNQAQIVNRSTATTPVLGDFINGLPLESGLQVLEGKSLLLLGGDVRLDGGILRAPGGRVELGGLSEVGVVELNADGDNFSLSFPDNVARANVSLTNGAGVTAAAGGGGSIAISAQTVDILGGSRILTGIAPGLGSVDSKAGDIEINATGTVTISELSSIGNSVFGIGDGGDIEIAIGSLEVTNGAFLSASTLGEGTAGSVRIRASDRIRFDGVGSNGVPSAAISGVALGAVGDSGDIEIITGSLEVTNGAFLSTSTLGEGTAGSVRIRAIDTVRFNGVGSNGIYSTASSSVGQGAVGDGGDIEIITGSLEVTNGGFLSANTFGEGNAGNIKITATDTVRFFDNAVSDGIPNYASSSVGQRAVGNGGDIEITTGSLEITNGAGLSTSTFGEGNAGNVKITATDTIRFDGVGSDGFSSTASSSVGQGAVGDGGDIEIIAGSLEVTNGAQLSASTFGKGNAGDVRIRTTEIVLFDGFGGDGFSSAAFSSVESGAVGDGGDIEITTGSLEITNGAALSASTFGEGNVGTVKITAADTVRFNKGSAFSSVEAGGVGNGGDLEIITGSLEVTNGAIVSASIFGEGNAGDVKITATDTVRFDGVGSNGESSLVLSRVAPGAFGNGGNLEITTGSLEVTNGAILSTSTLGEGNAGDVKITATDTVRFDGASNEQSSAAFSSVEAGAVGDGGDIEITTASLEVTNGAVLVAATLGKGNAGDVKIIATDTVHFDGVGSNGDFSRANSSVAAEAVGYGGNLEIITGSLEVTNGAALLTSTVGDGNAGDVKITASDTVRFDGVGDPSVAISAVGAGAVGDGGDIEINTGFLEVTNGAFLSASTVGEGNAGDVKITATDTVRFDGVGSSGSFSAASSSVAPGAVGDGGDIEITTGSLEVTNGAFLSANTFGEGNAGDVKITATDSVRFDGVGSNGESSLVLSRVAPGAVGNGGNLKITTGSLEVTNGAFLSTSTLGEGNAGDVKITANDTVRFDGVGSNKQSSAAFSSVEAGAIGDGGDIEITTVSLEVTNGAALVANTLGEGNAGGVKINATDTVRFDKGAALSAVIPGAIGTGGDIEITTGSLSLTDALISSESQGTGIAGDITINTRQNLETNRSSISATTLSGDGGDITLQVGNLLLLRDNSKISTTAGQAGAGGDGGNITIDAEFVIGVPREDSDITANAFNGRGGNITITTQGIFGLQFRDRLTPLSDITASSEFGLDGQFILNLLFPIDVTQGLSELPIEPVTSELNQSCQAGGSQSAGSFINTGRGGLPPEPTEPLDSSDLWEDVQLPRKTSTDAANVPTTPSGQIVEAQGWIVNKEGHIELVAQLPTTASDWGCRLH